MYGGRACPETIQQSLCLETDCDLLHWSISEVLTVLPYGRAYPRIIYIAEYDFCCDKETR